jgi:hypothetical protein
MTFYKDNNMPEQGRYEKIPRPDSIDMLIKYLDNSSAVESINRESDQVIYVERKIHPPLRIYMTNIYIVGLADVYDITSQAKDLGAIVTMSAWNYYTAEAKGDCIDRKIGLFTFKEILGAIFYSGQKFLDYVPPDQRKKKQ